MASGCPANCNSAVANCNSAVAANFLDLPLFFSPAIREG